MEISGTALLFVAFGGAVFGAIAATLVMTYAWASKATEREVWLERFKSKIRAKLSRRQPVRQNAD